VGNFAASAGMAFVASTILFTGAPYTTFAAAIAV